MVVVDECREDALCGAFAASDTNEEATEAAGGTIAPTKNRIATNLVG